MRRVSANHSKLSMPPALGRSPRLQIYMVRLPLTSESGIDFRVCLSQFLAVIRTPDKNYFHFCSLDTFLCQKTLLLFCVKPLLIFFFFDSFSCYAMLFLLYVHLSWVSSFVFIILLFINYIILFYLYYSDKQIQQCSSGNTQQRTKF